VEKGQNKYGELNVVIFAVYIILSKIPKILDKILTVLIIELSRL